MKSLLIALTLVCSSAFAQELDATAALTNVLAPGLYSGVSPEGIECSVLIAKSNKGIKTSAKMNGMTISREVETGTMYRWNPGTRYFLSSEKTYSTDGINSVEEVFRTLAVDTMTQYVVVARVIVNNRDVREDKVECVINL
ncbi:MAG: hypothetical protein K2P81_01640 [Bacteriovoracaceae bacterium]|nr:hypothetical protein [Bacteriovoracaceae bacterium]